MATDPCPFCSKKFSSLDFLSSHIERRHQDGPLALSFSGPNIGSLDDSEGEIRTSRLERQKTLWSPQTEAEREMSGARGSSDIRSTMRLQRARESSSGLWPMVIETSTGAGQRTPVVDAGKSFEARSGRSEHHERTQSPKSRHMFTLHPNSTFGRVSTDEHSLRRSWHSGADKSERAVPRKPVQDDGASSLRPSRQAQPLRPVSAQDLLDGHVEQGALDGYVACPLEECGEQVLSIEIVDHIERHQAEQLVLEGDDPSLDSIRPLSLPAEVLSQSLPAITIEDGVLDPRSNPRRAFDPDLPPYTSPTTSIASAGYSYYAPEKAELARADSLIAQTWASNANHLESVRRQPLAPIIAQEPPQIHLDNHHTIQARLAAPQASGTGPTMLSNSSAELNSHRPINSENIVAQNQERPRSAMAVLYQSSNKDTRISASGSGHGNQAMMASSSPVQSALPAHRSKRQSQIELAVNEVKDKVANWSLTGTVDSLERRIRASKERYEAGQLSKQALGPYAHEKEMPTWLYKQLKRGPRVHRHKTRGRDGRIYAEDIVENETPGIVPMLARLSELDVSVERAYFSHPATKHISKIRGEGGFCGYRNIQMQISYLQGAGARGHAAFPQHRTPGVLELQDMIESAWDAGHFAASRREIGQLRGTRKWIGSVEAHALFRHQNVDCEARTFIDDPVERRMAYENLFVWMETYFRANDGSSRSGDSGIHRKLVPPVYLQFPGHSVTVIGYEIHKQGERSLLVLDPMYVTSRAMNQFLDAGPRRIRRSRNEILHVYRRYETDFKKYSSIEVLFFSTPSPNSPAWDVRYPILRLQK